DGGTGTLKQGHIACSADLAAQTDPLVVQVLFVPDLIGHAPAGVARGHRADEGSIGCRIGGRAVIRVAGWARAAWRLDDAEHHAQAAGRSGVDNAIHRAEVDAAAVTLNVV